MDYGLGIVELVKDNPEWAEWANHPQPLTPDDFEQTVKTLGAITEAVNPTRMEDGIQTVTAITNEEVIAKVQKACEFYRKANGISADAAI